jgi:acyl-coenzyme A synthetase/AMP-(fatty) acid ligase
MNLAELIVERCLQRPDQVALISSRGRTSYRSLLRQIERRHDLIARRTAPGEVVSASGTVEELVSSYVATLLAERTFAWFGEVQEYGGTRIIVGDEIARQQGTHARPLIHDGAAAIVMTSGTSGQPKRVVHDLDTIGNGLLNTISVEAELTRESLPSDPRNLSPLLARNPYELGLLSGMPLESIAGLSMLNRVLGLGETMILPLSLRPDVIWTHLVSREVTNAGLPPIAAQEFLRAAQKRRWENPGLLSLGLGGSFVGPAIAEKLEARMGCPVTAGYGSTELGGVALMARPWDPSSERWSSMGRPIGRVEARLERVEGGVDELLVKSPAAMTGTLDDDGVLEHAPEWIRTGDSAATNSDGTFTIGGRLDFVIQRGGRRIDPARIERVLLNHEAVVAAAVLGQPSRIAGEQDIWALVQLHREVKLDELLKLCLRHLEVYEIPRRILIVKRIPSAYDGTPRRGLLPQLVGKHRGQRSSD